MMGKLIALEGPDGSGKTDAREFIVQTLQNMGYEVVATREPGGTPLAERIREILLAPSDEPMDPYTEAALFAGARKQHIEQLIRPSLEQGKIVVTDRFYWSSVAYQGFGGKLNMSVSTIHSAVCRRFQADHTLLFQVSPEIAETRLTGRGGTYRDRIEAKGPEYAARVREGYELEYAGALGLPGPERVTAIDANGDHASVNKQLLDWIVKTFPVKETA